MWSGNGLIVLQLDRCQDNAALCRVVLRIWMLRDARHNKRNF